MSIEQFEQDVNEAFAANKAKPIRGTFRTVINDEYYACAIGVLAPKERAPTEFVRSTYDISYHDIGGIIDGFDDLYNTPINSEDRGFAVGKRLAAKWCPKNL